MILLIDDLALCKPLTVSAAAAAVNLLYNTLDTQRAQLQYPSSLPASLPLPPPLPFQVHLATF